MARPRLGAGAQDGPRRAVRRRPAVQLAAEDGGGRPWSRPTDGRRAAAPSCACATSPGASATSPGCSTSTASWCATRTAGRTLLNALPMPAWFRDSERPHPVGQRGLRQGGRGRQREGGARAPDRAAGDAPARGGRGRRWPRAYPTASACTSSAAARARPTMSSSSRSTAPASGRPSTWRRWRRRRASWCGTWRPTSARSTGWRPASPSSAPTSG